MSKSNSEYVSPYSVGKRQTIYIDANDPRVRGFKASITASRLGSEIVIVNDPTISISGEASYIKFAGPSANLRVPDTFDPTNSDFIQPSTISNLSAAWSGQTLVISFDFDFSDDANKYVQGFMYRLTPTGKSVSAYERSTILNKSDPEQTINFTSTTNQFLFGRFESSFSSLEILAFDSFGNLGTAATLTSIPAYSSSLPAPTITVTAINQGYTVDWLEITEEYSGISVEEIESNANTAPTTGYTGIYLGDKTVKPATVIVSNANPRWVRARFTEGVGEYSPFSTAYKVTPESPVVVDLTAPDAPVWSGSGNSAGIDSTGTLGFNGFLNLSWTAVNDSTLRGYRIRYRPATSPASNYAYVDSPGTGTTYRLNGLAVGTTYEVGIASYDEFNNTSSSYTALSPNLTVSGTPFIGTNITTTGYFGASAGGETGEFRFGYGVETGKRGLRFDQNNYWYIDSSASASFRLGGPSSNYLQWNGGTFTIDGDITARSGSFAGNVRIISGGSVYSGTLNQIGNAITGAGFILNNDGLTFNSSNTNSITTINGETGLLTTSSAVIGGWNVSTVTNPNSLFKTSGTAPNINTIKLDSADFSVSVSGAGYTTGFGVADANNIVIWSGALRNTQANFYVTSNGEMTAKSATLVSGPEGSGQTPMKFGKNANGAGLDGIYINSANYWYNTAEFSLGGGRISGTHDTLTIDLGAGLNASTTKFFLTNLPATDDDSWAGDPTITIRDDNRIVRGRRFIFNSNISGNTSPTNPSSGGTTDNGNNNWFDPTTRVGEYLVGTTQRPVKAGDILMIQE